MPQARGANAQTIIQEESSFGVDPTPGATKLYFVSNSLRLSRGNISSETIQANRNPSAPARDVDDISGPLAVDLQAYIGLLLKAALGSVTTTGTDPYAHTIKVGSSLPSLLVERGFTDINQFFKYNGVKVSRLSFGVTPKGFQRLSLDLLGASETVGTSSFDASPTDLGYQPFDGFTISTIEEGGSAIGDVLGIDNLSIDNGLDGDQYLVGGAGQRVDIPEGMVKVSGTLRARFANTTLYTKATARTESSLRIVYSLGDGLGSAGNESIEFKVPELYFAPAAPPVEGPKGVVVSLDFEGFYSNAAEASSLQVILKNTQSAI